MAFCSPSHTYWTIQWCGNQLKQASGTVISTFFQSKYLQIISYSKKYFPFRHCVRLASQPADAKSRSTGHDRRWIFHQYQQSTTFKATEGSGCHHIFKLYYWITYIGEEDLVTVCCLSFCLYMSSL